MTMNRETLKQYAEFGVRERLREIQRELEILARDFPHLVRNADGSLPSVIPTTAKPDQRRPASATNGNVAALPPVPGAQAPARQPKRTRPAGRLNKPGSWRSKIQQQRARTAARLAKFDPETPSPATAFGHAAGVMVQRGYLARKGVGYIRTAKPFQI